jgi:hypothetical protein
MSKLSEETILTIAQAILANTKVLQSLVDSLPKEAKAKVEAEVAKDTPVPTPAATPAPIPVAPVMATPTPVAPVPVAPAPASPSSSVPFADAKGMIAYVMDAYKALGPVKGSAIQQVLGGLGINTINEVKPEHYAALFAGVEKLKVS